MPATTPLLGAVEPSPTRVRLSGVRIWGTDRHAASIAQMFYTRRANTRDRCGLAAGATPCTPAPEVPLVIRERPHPGGTPSALATAPQRLMRPPTAETASEDPGATPSEESHTFHTRGRNGGGEIAPWSSGEALSRDHCLFLLAAPPPQRIRQRGLRMLAVRRRGRADLPVEGAYNGHSACAPERVCEGGYRGSGGHRGEKHFSPLPPRREGKAPPPPNRTQRYPRTSVPRTGCSEWRDPRRSPGSRTRTLACPWCPGSRHPPARPPSGPARSWDSARPPQAGSRSARRPARSGRRPGPRGRTS